MKRSSRYMVSLLLALGVYILLHFTLKIPPFIPMIVGILVYAISMGTLKRKEDVPVFLADGVTKQQVEEIIRTGKKKVRRIRDIAVRIQKKEIKEQVERICSTADAIFEDFKQDPADVKVARKFLSYYLDTTESILKKYVKLSNKNMETEDVKEALERVENVLDKIESTFKKQLEKLLENDVLNLDVEISLLEKTMKSEGI